MTIKTHPSDFYEIQNLFIKHDESFFNEKSLRIVIEPIRRKF